jgi:hypothetical protein
MRQIKHNCPYSIPRHIMAGLITIVASSAYGFLGVVIGVQLGDAAWLAWLVVVPLLTFLLLPLLFPSHRIVATCAVLFWIIAPMPFTFMTISIAAAFSGDIDVLAPVARLLSLLAPVPLAVTLAWGIICTSFSKRRRLRIQQALHCTSCGYDLSGLNHERCPECGERA